MVKIKKSKNLPTISKTDYPDIGKLDIKSLEIPAEVWIEGGKLVSNFFNYLGERETTKREKERTKQVREMCDVKREAIKADLEKALEQIAEAKEKNLLSHIQKMEELDKVFALKMKKLSIAEKAILVCLASGKDLKEISEEIEKLKKIINTIEALEDEKF